MQTNKRHSGEYCEEGERLEDGIQMHGKHPILLRRRPEVRRSLRRALPNHRPLGATESDVRSDMPAVVGPQGVQTRRPRHRTQGVGGQRQELQR